jgi:RHS repeat-associated protein
LGGWTLSGHQVYDPVARVVHMGNGYRRRAGSLARTLTSVDLPGQSILFDVDVGPDGSQYVALPHGDLIIRIAPDGSQGVVAGNGIEGFSGDGGPATQAELGDPTGVAVAPDGSLYIAEQANHRVRKVAPDGTISTVAGSGSPFFGGDGGPATQAGLIFAERIAVAPDASFYVLDGNSRVRRVTPDGIINTVAGTGSLGFSGDGGPATAARINASSISAAPDGGFYIADFLNQRVRRVGPDGVIKTVVDYTSVSGQPVSVRPTRDGSLLIGVQFATARTPEVDLLQPNGTLVTVAGGGPSPIEQGIPATQANLVALRAVALGPDGSVFMVRGDASDLVLRVGPALPGFEGTQTLIASVDGSQLYTFDTDGKHLQTLNGLTGAVLFEYGYDANGRLNQVTEKTGDIDNITIIQHDVSGNPTKITGPFGQVTTLAVDANGFLSAITNPAGEALQLTSDSGGLLQSYTDPRGKTSHFTFDADGRLLQDADPVGGVQNLARTTDGNEFTVTRTTALGRTTTYTTQNLAGNQQVRLTTEPDGTQSQTQEAVDAGTFHAVAGNGTITSTLIGPDPRFGMEAAVPTTMNIVLPSNLTLNGSHARTAVLSNPSDPLSLVSLTDTSTVNGRISTSAFSASTKTFATTTPSGRTASLTIDSLARPVTSQVSGLAPASFTYDNRGRVTTVTHGNGIGARTISFSYNTNGFLQSITDPLGQIAQFTYDQAGRALTKILPGGRVVSLSYDAAGNIASISPPDRPAHAFAYSDRGEVIAMIPPSVPGTGAFGYSYDLDKQLTAISRPDGRALVFGYDAAGRLASRSLVTGAVTTGTDTLSYDGAGRPAAIAGSNGVTTSYSYDGSLLTGWSWSGVVTGNVTRTYDSSFRIASESVNGANTVNLTYDDDDLLVGSGALTIARNTQNGLPTDTTLGTVTTTMGYNAFGEVTSYAASAGGSTLFSDALTRDLLGRITQKTETIGGATDTYVYAYDEAGELASVTKNGATSESYGYDGNGNRTSATVAGVAVSAAYDDQDRLNQYGGETFVYDAAGDLSTRTIGAQVTSYQYDQLGNLLAVTLPDGTAVTYLVDGDNRRIAKKVNGSLVKAFLYRDDLRPAVELDGPGTVVSRFIYAGKSAPATMIKEGVTFRLITDQAGSVRLVVDAASGAVVQRMDYDSFGNVMLDTNPGFQPFGFAGGLYDPDTRLVRFGARDYDSSAGRWTAKDLIGFAGDDTNLYRYARNDPVNRLDPFGLLDKTQCNTLHSLLAYEDAHGTWQTAAEFSETFGQRRLGTLGDDANVPTALGSIDLDWYTDLVYATGAGTMLPVIGGVAGLSLGPGGIPFGMGVGRAGGVAAMYVLGKLVWNVLGMAAGTREHFRAPFNDPKEGVAVKALTLGNNSYHDLFPDSFLNSICPCGN